MGRIFEYAISLDYMPPQRSFAMYATIMTLPRFMFTVKNFSWSSCMVSLHWREELPLQHNARVPAITFTTTTSLNVAILKNSNTVAHVPRDSYFLQKSSSSRKMTCIVDVKGDTTLQRDNLNLHTCRCSPGGVKTSQTTLCRNLGERRGRAYYRRGRISGRLRYIHIHCTCTY